MREHVSDAGCCTTGARALIEHGREIARGGIIHVVRATRCGSTATALCLCRIIASDKSFGCGFGIEIATAIVRILSHIDGHTVNDLDKTILLSDESGSHGLCHRGGSIKETSCKGEEMDCFHGICLIIDLFSKGR